MRAAREDCQAGAPGDAAARLVRSVQLQHLAVRHHLVLLARDEQHRHRQLGDARVVPGAGLPAELSPPLRRHPPKPTLPRPVLHKPGHF